MTIENRKEQLSQDYLILVERGRVPFHSSLKLICVKRVDREEEREKEREKEREREREREM